MYHVHELCEVAGLKHALGVGLEVGRVEVVHADALALAILGAVKHLVDLSRPQTHPFGAVD